MKVTSRELGALTGIGWTAWMGCWLDLSAFRIAFLLIKDEGCGDTVEQPAEPSKLNRVYASNRPRTALDEARLGVRNETRDPRLFLQQSSCVLSS